MFTFGREHEKKCATRDLKKKEQADLILAVVDAVHDLLEGKISEGAARPILSQAFVEGGSGVWERTGSWLRKLVMQYPELKSLWIEFADHSQWKVRFRAACFIDDMPVSTARTVGEKLKNDSNKKVREMAMAKQNCG